MSIETREPSPENFGEDSVHAERGEPRDWKDALLTLAFSRMEIVCIEAKSASSVAFGKFALLTVGVFALFSAWALALVASIGLIAASSTWEWYHVAFASAGAHLLIGGVFLLILKAKKTESFPVTRSEFQKDREWLSRLKKP